MKVKQKRLCGSVTTNQQMKEIGPVRVSWLSAHDTVFGYFCYFLFLLAAGVTTDNSLVFLFRPAATALVVVEGGAMR